jgi:site-specific recombinase XerD
MNELPAEAEATADLPNQNQSAEADDQIVDLAAFVSWLRRGGSSAHTTRAYARWLAQLSLFLEQSGRRLPDVMADEHERSFAARDFRVFLRHSRKLAPASVNQALAALHTFCQFKGVGVPQVRREALPQLAPRALSADEQRRLLRAVERLDLSRDRAIAYTLFYTGLRIGECAALDLADVIVSDRRGKLIVWKGKGDRQREVPLHPLARQALLAWKQERTERFGGAASAAFFLNYQGGRLSARSIDSLMDRVGDEAGVAVSAHVLRHTFATNLIRGGQDLVLVAEITGHARLETVRRYSLPTHQDLEKAVESLPTDN